MYICIYVICMYYGKQPEETIAQGLEATKPDFLDRENGTIKQHQAGRRCFDFTASETAFLKTLRPRLVPVRPPFSGCRNGN